ncbi:MAG: hypothetical protein QM739_04025 [Propionivibrio sp.]
MFYRTFWGGGLVEATTKQTAKVKGTATTPAGDNDSPDTGGRVQSARHGTQQQQQNQKDWSDRLFERLEGARLIYWRVHKVLSPPGLYRKYDYLLNELLLDVPGSGVRHQINLQALVAAGIEVIYDKSGKSRYLVLKYKDKVVIVSEGITSSVNGGGFLSAGAK